MVLPQLSQLHPKVDDEDEAKNETAPRVVESHQECLLDAYSIESLDTREDSISVYSYNSSGSIISRAHSEIIIGQSCDKCVPSERIKEILETSLRNPHILVGYEVYVEKYGIGIIKDCLRMKFFATKFDICFNNGRRKAIKLKRSELKNGSNFTLLRKLT